MKCFLSYLYELFKLYPALYVLSFSKNTQNSELLTDEDKESSSQSKCDSTNINQSQTEEVDADSWDAMFDDDGECLDPSAMDEVRSMNY